MRDIGHPCIRSHGLLVPEFSDRSLGGNEQRTAEDVAARDIVVAAHIGTEGRC